MVNQYVKLKKVHGRPDFVDNETKTRQRIIAELRKRPEGMTIIEISEQTNLSRQTASKYVLALISEGTVKIRKVGPAKLCYLKRWGKKSGRR